MRLHEVRLDLGRVLEDGNLRAPSVVSRRARRRIARRPPLTSSKLASLISYSSLLSLEMASMSCSTPVHNRASLSLATLVSRSVVISSIESSSTDAKGSSSSESSSPSCETGEESVSVAWEAERERRLTQDRLERRVVSCRLDSRLSARVQGVRRYHQRRPQEHPQLTTRRHIASRTAES